MKIEYSPKFHKQYYKLNSEIQTLTDIKINLFINKDKVVFRRIGKHDIYE